jgi:hypothetical protein
MKRGDCERIELNYYKLILTFDSHINRILFYY